MTTLGERPFHVLMGGLVVGSLFLDAAMRHVLPAWNPPQVGLSTLVLGFVWVGAFTAYRLRGFGDRQRVLEDRVQRAERKLEHLDLELAVRHRAQRP